MALTVGPGGATVGPAGGLLGPTPPVEAASGTGAVGATIANVRPNAGASTGTGAATAAGRGVLPSAATGTGSAFTPIIPIIGTGRAFDATISLEVPPTSPIEFLWDGVELENIEWDANGEEVVGSVGRATVTIQDRDVDSAFEPEPHTSVLIRIRSSGWVLFRGESMVSRVELPPGVPWRRWVIECRDYNGQIGERLVGAPPGGIYWSLTPEDPPQPIDPSGMSWATDAASIQNWVDSYMLLPTGEPIDTATHVHEYVPNDILGDPRYIMNVQQDMTTLADMVSRLAAMADVNVQDWICPDRHWHHVEIPPWEGIAGAGDLELAPYELWDRVYAPDGTTAIGHAGINFEFDGQTMPEKVYAQGATTFVFDGENPEVTGGSGWVPGLPNRTERQAYLSIPDAWDQTRRDLVAGSALLRAADPVMRASVEVRGWMDPDTHQLESRDGWRAGMVVTIRDPRLSATMKSVQDFVIQRVGWSLVAGTRLISYSLGFGDGPPSRGAQRRVNEIDKKPKPKKPIVTWVVDAKSVGDIAPDESRDLVFTPVNGLGEPWGPPGLPVEFRAQAYDSDTEVEVLGQGSFDPDSTTTDDDGKARTTFTAGSQENLYYKLFCESDIGPA